MLNIKTLYNRFHSQIQNLSIYFLAALLPMILSLVTNPFIAKNMSPPDYAITGYYQAFNTLFLPLINFYLLHYYTKRYYELESAERLKLKSILFKALIGFSLFMSLVAIIVLALYTKIFNANTSIPFYPYALISILSLPITGIYTLNLMDYRMSRASKKFFTLSITNGSLGVVIALLFVVVFKWGALGRLGATLLSCCIIFIYILIKNRSLFSISFDNKIFKNAISFCWPLVIASMLTFFSSGYDKVVLERTSDIVNLGIYSVGFTIAGYMNIFSTAINDTFQPDIFQHIVQRNYRKSIQIIGIKISIISICVLGFIVFAPYIIDILTYGRYINSTKFAIIISLSAVSSMLYYSMSQITIALGFTSITLWNKVIGSILSIISFNILIKNFGAIGAAWGVVFSYLYFFLGNVIMVICKYKITDRRL